MEIMTQFKHLNFSYHCATREEGIILNVTYIKILSPQKVKNPL